MNETVCSHCSAVFEMAGDNWYQVSRMHQDRIGDGPHRFCSSYCAQTWIEEQEDVES